MTHSQSLRIRFALTVTRQDETRRDGRAVLLLYPGRWKDGVVPVNDENHTSMFLLLGWDGGQHQFSAGGELGPMGEYMLRTNRRDPKGWPN